MRPEEKRSIHVGPCGLEKGVSPFPLRDALEGFEQRTAGSVWLLRRR